MRTSELWLLFLCTMNHAPESSPSLRKARALSPNLTCQNSEKNANKCFSRKVKTFYNPELAQFSSILGVLVGGTVGRLGWKESSVVRVVLLRGRALTPGDDLRSTWSNPTELAHHNGRF